VRGAARVGEELRMSDPKRFNGYEQAIRLAMGDRSAFEVRRYRGGVSTVLLLVTPEGLREWRIERPGRWTRIDANMELALLGMESSRVFLELPDAHVYRKVRGGTTEARSCA
jgi:hypothetical protein